MPRKGQATEFPEVLEGMGARLKKAMRDRHMDQTALGKAAGCGQGAISLITRDEKPEVSAATMARIADALDVSLDWLLLGQGEVIPRLYSAEPVPMSERAPQKHRVG